MKTKIITLLTILTILNSCKKEEKKVYLPTKDIDVENIIFQLPTDFIENGINSWMYQKPTKKIASIDINESAEDDLKSALDFIKSKKMESAGNKYTLIEAKQGDTLGKKYIIETYKFNNSDYIGGYPVYSYETYSAIETGNKILTLNSFSLGFNFNDTMKKSVLNIKPIK